MATHEAASTVDGLPRLPLVRRNSYRLVAAMSLAMIAGQAESLAAESDPESPNAARITLVRPWDIDNGVRPVSSPVSSHSRILQIARGTSTPALRTSDSPAAQPQAPARAAPRMGGAGANAGTSTPRVVESAPTRGTTTGVRGLSAMRLGGQSSGEGVNQGVRRLSAPARLGMSGGGVVMPPSTSAPVAPQVTSPQGTSRPAPAIVTAPPATGGGRASTPATSGGGQTGGGGQSGGGQSPGGQTGGQTGVPAGPAPINPGTVPDAMPTTGGGGGGVQTYTNVGRPETGNTQPARRAMPGDIPAPPPAPGGTQPPTPPPPGGGIEPPAGGGEEGAGEFVMLVPGDGFSGPTLQPPAVGAPDMAGYDAKVIARWDVVPYQTFTGEFNVGVVAFHINGIDRVDFSVNGGPWHSVFEMELNPQTNVWEYTATLRAQDFADGPVEVRAIAWPRGAGEARVLAGPLTTGVATKNGNHSIVLNSNGNGTLPQLEAFCSPSGSDTAGDGSRGAPFQTPGGALAALSRRHTSVDGATIYLEPGNYAWGGVGNTRPVTSTRWVTFAPAPGVAKSEVIFSSSILAGFRTRLVKAEGLTFVGQDLLRSAGESFVWIDDCRMIGPGRQTNSAFFSEPWWTGSYFTRVEASDNRNGIRSAHFIRHCNIHTISGSPFGASRVVISSQASRYDNSGTEFHGDVFHWFYQSDDNENFIVYNVEATEFDSQGLFAEVMTNGRRMDNIAMVNVHISKNNVSANGSWWETDTNHLLMWYVSLPDQSFRWAHANYGTMLQNVSIRGSIIHAFTTGDVPASSDVRDNHYTNPSFYGARLLGRDYTTGPNVFVDIDALNYSPFAGSALAERLPRSQLGVAADLRGVPRAEQTAIGPFAGVDETHVD